MTTLSTHQVVSPPFWFRQTYLKECVTDAMKIRTDIHGRLGMHLDFFSSANNTSKSENLSYEMTKLTDRFSCVAAAGADRSHSRQCLIALGSLRRIRSRYVSEGNYTVHIKSDNEKQQRKSG